MPTLEAGSIDAIIADPPFGIGFKYESHDDTPDNYGEWLWSIIEQAESLCTPGAPVFVWQAMPNIRKFADWFPRDYRIFAAAKNFVQMRPTAMQYSYDPVVVWWTPGDRWSEGTCNRDFHIANTAPVVASPTNIQRGHPCPRPVDQMRHIVEQWVKEGSVCFDPFMGSGTTGIACIRTGRSFVGIEKEPRYFDIAVRRIEAELQQPRLFPVAPAKETQTLLEGVAC